MEQLCVVGVRRGRMRGAALGGGIKAGDDEKEHFLLCTARCPPAPPAVLPTPWGARRAPAPNSAPWAGFLSCSCFGTDPYRGKRVCAVRNPLPAPPHAPGHGGCWGCTAAGSAHHQQLHGSWGLEVLGAVLSAQQPRTAPLPPRCRRGGGSTYGCPCCRDLLFHFSPVHAKPFAKGAAALSV